MSNIDIDRMLVEFDKQESTDLESQNREAQQQKAKTESLAALKKAISDWVNPMAQTARRLFADAGYEELMPDWWKNAGIKPPDPNPIACSLVAYTDLLKPYGAAQFVTAMAKPIQADSSKDDVIQERARELVSTAIQNGGEATLDMLKSWFSGNLDHASSSLKRLSIVLRRLDEMMLGTSSSADAALVQAANEADLIDANAVAKLVWGQRRSLRTNEWGAEFRTGKGRTPHYWRYSAILPVLRKQYSHLEFPESRPNPPMKGLPSRR